MSVRARKQLAPRSLKWSEVEEGDRIISAKCKLWQPLEQLEWEGIKI